MSFIDNVTKSAGKIGNIVKETYGPLAPLDAYQQRAILRYPLDVGDSRRYPHTVEFQTWKPTQIPITDMGAVQAAQTKAAELTNKLADSKFGKFAEKVIGGYNKLKGGTGNFEFGNIESFVETPTNMKVNRNQRWNNRMMDFTRRAEISDLITMYLPQGTWNDRINNAYTQKSMTEAMGSLGAIIDVAGSIIKEEDLTAVEMLNGPAGMEALGKMAGALGMDEGTIRDAGLASIGYALNPQFEMLYSGTDLREFQFDFTMTPRNADEARMIHKIIKKFKYHGSPAFVSGQGRYIVPPSYFDITFKFNGGDNDWLPQISTCVLKSFDVDYTGALEQWASHEDGSPIQVRMVLIFQELEMMHKSLRKKGY